MASGKGKGITVNNRVSITARAECIPGLLKVAKTLESNPNAVMNDCLAGCLAEMQRPVGASIRPPEIIARYRQKAGMLQVEPERENEHPVAARIGNLISLLNEELVAIRESRSTRNAIAIAAINAALNEESRLLTEMRERLESDRQSAFGEQATARPRRP